jgi:hypothetical protein
VVWSRRLGDRGVAASRHQARGQDRGRDLFQDKRVHDAGAFIPGQETSFLVEGSLEGGVERGIVEGGIQRQWLLCCRINPMLGLGGEVFVVFYWLCFLERVSVLEGRKRERA